MQIIAIAIGKCERIKWGMKCKVRRYELGLVLDGVSTSARDAVQYIAEQK